MVSLRREEWDELTPEEKREHLILEEKNVFGHDVKHDRHGRPIEQGIGSPSQPSMNHFRALGAAEGAEVAEKAIADARKNGWEPERAAEAQRALEDAIKRGEVKRLEVK
jgi:hypothetical protein